MARKRSTTRVTPWVKLQDTVVGILKEKHMSTKYDALRLYENYLAEVENLVGEAWEIIGELRPTTTEENSRKKAKAAVTTFLKG